MTTDKTPNQHSKSKLIEEKNPLADIAGKFGGKFWSQTQSEIQHRRKIDREEMSKLLKTNSDFILHIHK